MGNWATLTFPSQPASTNEELLLVVVPEKAFLAVLAKYCINRDVRDQSAGVLKYTDCVAIRDTILGAPRASRQVLILGAFGNAYIKVIKGVSYIIFKGYAGNRTLLQWLAAGLKDI